MGKTVETNLPCPCTLSSDAYAIYDDGRSYCYGQCGGKYFNKRETDKYLEERIDSEVVKVEHLNTNYISKFDQPIITSKIIPVRGLSENTCRHYGIQVVFKDGEPHEISLPYTKGYKFRGYKEKTFRSEGNMKDAGLFGKERFDPGSKDSITITEGEFDAASVYQITSGRTCGVSVRSASQAKRDCTADRDYINSFKKIILCFDNDEIGQKAAKEVASLFDFNKIYLLKLIKYKDANKYLEEGEGPEFLKAWENVRRYSPDNIISSFVDIRKSLKKSAEDQIGTYPWPTLQSMTYGMHRGEVIIWKGLEKIGKTEVFRALEHHLLKTTKANIGIIHLEEDNGTTVKGIAQYELKQPAMLPDSGLSEQDIFDAYVSAVNNDDRRVHLYQSYDVEDEDVFWDNVRFLVAGAGCEFIFWDHITWMATGRGDEDERKKLDRMSQRAKLLGKELGHCTHIISHTNDLGQTRGSRNITKVANTIVHLERDKIHADESIRRSTYPTLEGVRLGGNTGPAGRLYLDPVTSVLKEWEVLDMPQGKEINLRETVQIPSFIP